MYVLCTALKVANFNLGANMGLIDMGVVCKGHNCEVIVILCSIPKHLGRTCLKTSENCGNPPLKQFVD